MTYCDTRSYHLIRVLAVRTYNVIYVAAAKIRITLIIPYNTRANNICRH